MYFSLPCEPNTAETLCMISKQVAPLMSTSLVCSLLSWCWDLYTINALRHACRPFPYIRSTRNQDMLGATTRLCQTEITFFFLVWLVCSPAFFRNTVHLDCWRLLSDRSPSVTRELSNNPKSSMLATQIQQRHLCLWSHLIQHCYWFCASNRRCSGWFLFPNVTSINQYRPTEILSTAAVIHICAQWTLHYNIA